MAAGTAPRQAPRGPLTRDAVVRAAMAIADRGGIGAVSMRRLGDELGVEAMSLYHHVENKSRLLALMFETARSEIEPPSHGAYWRADIRTSAISCYEALLRHPWLNTVTASAGISISLLRYMDALLRRLREAGFSPELVDHAYHALDSHIAGSAFWETEYRSWSATVDVGKVVGTALQMMPAAQHPDFYAHAQQHRAGSEHSGKRQFEFGLDLILDGLERLGDGTGSAAATPEASTTPPSHARSHRAAGRRRRRVTGT